MKRIAIYIAILGLPATCVFADMVWVSNGYGLFNSAVPGRGGEFNMTTDAPVLDLVSGQSFNLGNFTTFCIEVNETIAQNNAYDIVLDDKSVLGGVAGGSPDPLSGKTAALFQMYWDGAMGVHGAVDTNVEAAALQNALWFLENELDHLGGKYAGFTTGSATDVAVRDYIDKYLALVSTVLDTDPIGKVRVVNVWLNGGYGVDAKVRQSVLVSIPAPGAALLVFAGLGLVGWVKRRLS